MDSVKKVLAALSVGAAFSLFNRNDTYEFAGGFSPYGKDGTSERGSRRGF